MTKNRRRFSAEYKFRVALEAAKGQATISELANKYGLHPNQISQWKRQLLESGADVFSRNGDKAAQAESTEQAELYAADWPPQDGVGVAEKKSCSFRLMQNGSWLSQAIRS